MSPVLENDSAHRRSRFAARRVRRRLSRSPEAHERPILHRCSMTRSCAFRCIQISNEASRLATRRGDRAGQRPLVCELLELELAQSYARPPPQKCTPKVPRPLDLRTRHCHAGAQTARPLAADFPRQVPGSECVYLPRTQALEPVSACDGPVCGCRGKRVIHCLRDVRSFDDTLANAKADRAAYKRSFATRLELPNYRSSIIV
jgi:hypothetical protein